MLTNEEREMILSGRKYTSIGCYPLMYVTADGAALCGPCCKEEAYNIRTAWDTDDKRGGWYVEAYDANWEDPALYCDHCGGRIESAYAEDDSED